MYYTIYKVTNKINGKIYIGSHKTKDLKDNYMGSGKYLKYAQDKHGIENFTKEILFVFDTPEPMYAKEAELVNEDFIAESNTYNLKVGGFGGWDYVNSNEELRVAKNKKAMDSAKKVGIQETAQAKLAELRKDTEWHNAVIEKQKQSMLDYNRSNPGSFTGKQHTDDTKRIIGEKNSKHQRGNGNSQFGKKWIYSETEKVSRKISKKDPLPKGYLEGRKIKF